MSMSDTINNKTPNTESGYTPSKLGSTATATEQHTVGLSH